MLNNLVQSASMQARLLASLCLLLVPLSCVYSAALPPQDNEFGRTCNYTAKNIPSDLFFQGLSRRYMFPLEDESRALWAGDKPWQACFNSSEPYDLAAIQAAKKLPCSYTVTQSGTVDYWEEHACQESLKSNCYCFAVNRYVGSYCSPGEASLPSEFQDELTSCDWAVKGVIADGGVQVDRATVDSKQPKGHYIAVAVIPGGQDMHMWRLESNGSWANKPGAYMPRRTYGSENAVITDVEAPGVLGRYANFCGYFEVFPETHKLKGNDYWSYGLPDRFEAWNRISLQAGTVPLSSISKGWMLAYKEFWQVSGSNSPNTAEAGRKLKQITRKQLHGMSRPPHPGAAKP